MRNVERNIWIIVLFLLISVMLTLMLLSPVFVRLTKSDRNIIPLFYNGDREIFDKNGFSYIRVEKDPDVHTLDKNGQFQVSADVDLFKAAYANDKGDITVEGLNGDKIIAPGTSNKYEFTLKNTGNISLDYTMRLDNVFTLLDYNLPMQVRLRGGERWILGSENSWVYAKSISDVIESGTIDVNKQATYTFEWQWPFEDDADGDRLLNDLNDTIIANEAVDQNVTFRFSIKTQCVITPGAVPADGSGTELVEPLVLWNIITRILLPAVIVVGMVIILLVLFRNPIYVTGFIPAGTGDEIDLDKKKTHILSFGRFVFKKVYKGKHRLVLGGRECLFRLRTDRRTEGIAFETEDGVLVIKVNRKVRAVELYMLLTGSDIIIIQNKWAAIDKKRNVITPDGVKEPENDQNTTPGGLHINEDGYFETEHLSL